MNCVFVRPSTVWELMWALLKAATAGSLVLLIPLLLVLGSVFKIMKLLITRNYEYMSSSYQKMKFKIFDTGTTGSPKHSGYKTFKNVASNITKAISDLCFWEEGDEKDSMHMFKASRAHVGTRKKRRASVRYGFFTFLLMSRGTRATEVKNPVDQVFAYAAPAPSASVLAESAIYMGQ